MSSAAKRIYHRAKSCIANFLFPKKRTHKFVVIALLVVTIISGVVFFAEPVAAQLGFGDPGWLVSGLMQFFSRIMVKLAVICIQITLWLLRMFMLVAGYNNYINAPVVILGWNMVRDVANMFFIVVLMVIAFGTILGLEQYEWKKTLVKLIIAALFVNFSNMILQLMIDVAQVFTITFLNAVAGAAGGNLIQMFNIEKIFSIAVSNAQNESISIEIFGGAVMSLVFAAVAMFTMGAYVIILLARLVVLWALIILSPLAFVFQALPQTKSYADEFWSEFTNHVLAAPVMVFFLWLAFSTFGGEGITGHLELSHPLGGQARVSNTEDITGQAPSASFNQAASWDNMANFAIAIAFLWMGVERVQKLGVRAGGLAQGALDFGKKVATIASGYAAGRWLYENAAKPGAAGIVKHLPVIGTDKWKTRGQVEWESLKGWYYGKGMEPQKGIVGKAVGWTARQSISTEKRLAKTQKQAENRKKILWKRTGSEAGGILLPAITGGRIGMSRSKMRDAQDRIEEGWLQAEEMRSHAKDEEYHNLGKMEVLTSPRYKAGAKLWSRAKYETENGTMAERIAEHEFLGHWHHDTIDEAQKEAKIKILTGGRKMPRTYGQAMASHKQKAGAQKKGATQMLEQDKQVAEAEREIIYNNKLIERAKKQASAEGISDDERKRLDVRVKSMEQAQVVRNSKLGQLKGSVEAQRKQREDQGLIEKAYTPDELFFKQAQTKVASDRLAKIEEGGLNKKLTTTYKAGALIDEMGEKIKRGVYNDLLKKAGFNIDDKSLAELAMEIKHGNKELIQQLLGTAEKEKDVTSVAKFGDLRDAVDQGGVHAWEYATAAGLATDISKGQRLSHNSLLAEGQQRAVNDARKLPTPKNAFANLVEEFSKDFSSMSINAFVRAFGDSISTYVDKTEKGEVTDADRAQLMALFNRGFDRAWIDDAIYGITDNPEAYQKIAQHLGWKDSNFTPDKIRDVQMLFASSGNVDFVKDHAVMSRILDVGENDYRMSTPDIIAAMQGKKNFGVYDRDGKLVKEKTIDEVRADIELTKKNDHISWTSVQEGLFDRILNKQANTDVDKWLDVQRDRQAEFEFLGNLRGEAIKGAHTENAGWALNRAVSDKEALYIGGGTRMARGHVIGDVKKTDVRLRSAFHPHTVAKVMTEKFGQTMLMLNEDLLSVIRNGIDDMRTWSNTTPRWINHMLGFSATDETKNFKDDETGSLRIGASKNSQDAWKDFFKQNYNIDNIFEGLDEEGIEKKTGELIMHNILIPQLRANQKDFLLTAAKVTGVDSLDAINLGKMKMKIAGVEITNINQLVDLYEKGAFGSDINWETGQRNEGAGALRVDTYEVPERSKEQEKERKRLSEEDSQRGD